MKINKTNFAVILAVLVISGINAQGQSDAKTVSFEPDIKKLAGDFKFTEGPASDKEGNV